MRVRSITSASRHDELRSDIGIADRVEISRIGKACALLPLVDAGAARKHKFGDAMTAVGIPAGCAGNTTRKYRAVTASNATVRSTRLLKGISVTLRKSHTIVARLNRGGMRVALVVEDTDLIAQAGQRHRLDRLRMAVIELDPCLVARLARRQIDCNRLTSPSESAAMFTVPLLDVTCGFSSACVLSPAGILYAITAASA